MSSNIFDITIIGGGIVGMATALALSDFPHVRICILEAENQLAAHQTGNNSGVIHSGIYYKPGSLKAKNCTEGREELITFCQRHGIPFERCGKVIVATRLEELPALENLEKRAAANGLVGVRRLSPSELKEYEPHTKGIAALHVPQTGIVDYKSVVAAYEKIVSTRDGHINKGWRVTAISPKNSEIIIQTTQGEIRTRNLINCAGLQSDRIAKMSGVNPGLQIIPFRGEYYEIIPEKQYLVRNLIYPVPDPRFPFLGVHFTRMVKGGIEAGPNAVLAFKREGYKFWDISPKDIATYLFYGGFWKMSLKNIQMGVGEMYRSLSKRAFVHALQALVPEIGMDDVHRSGAGVRAQALLPDGQLVDDFRIVEASHMIHVLNAPSPAATASLSIGKTIAKMAEINFSLAS